MTWRDRLRTASFRGVTFEVEGREGRGGRRIALHEYPGRDLPYAEDMGRAARLSAFDAFIVGDDYFDRRDRLIAALETARPGTLVDPWLGERRVAVRSFSYRETLGDGRMVRFSIEFIEAGDKRYPAAATDTKAVVEASADAVLAASQTSFARVYSAGGQPQFVADTAADLARDCAIRIGELAGSLPLFAPAASGVAAAADRLASDAATLAWTADPLAARLVHAIRSLARAVADPAALVGGLAALTAFGGDFTPVPGPTPARRRQASNRQALSSLIRRAGVAERVRGVRNIAFRSYDDAVAVRDDLAAALDVEIAAAGGSIAGAVADEAAFTTLRDLRASMVRDIDTRGANLARVVTTANPDVRPALVVSYALYGDAARDGEIVARNRIAHPGFVASSRLDVLGA